MNSRSFSMIFLSFQRGTAPNSVSVLMNGHLKHFGLSVGRSCLPHPLFHFHKDHEKLIAPSKPSLRAHHPLHKTQKPLPENIISQGDFLR